MAALVGYYDDKREEFVFTKPGLKMAAENAMGKWKIVAELEGLVREEDLPLLEDDTLRHLVAELSEHSDITEDDDEFELTGDEVCRRVTRVTRLDNSKISLRDALSELYAAKEDIFVGFVGFYDVELKLYRTDFTKKFGGRKKKRKK